MRRSGWRERRPPFFVSGEVESLAHWWRWRARRGGRLRRLIRGEVAGFLRPDTTLSHLQLLALGLKLVARPALEAGVVVLLRCEQGEGQRLERIAMVAAMGHDI